MNLQENINRIKQVMGINESVLGMEDELNRILDKINSDGIDSLNNKEKVFLQTYTTDGEVEDKSTRWGYVITLTHPKITNMELGVRLIKHILDKNNIHSEVTQRFAFPMMWFEANIQYEFELENAMNVLSDKGFTIMGSEPVEENDDNRASEILDKVKINHSKPLDIRIRPNHGFNLDNEQESKRIKKILGSVNTGGYTIVTGDNNTYNININRKEIKDTLIDMFKDRGYNIL